MPSQSEWWSTFFSGIVLDTRMGFYPEKPSSRSGRCATSPIRGDRTETKVASYRVYPYRELRGLLREAGFRRLEGLSSLTGEPFAWGAKGLYLIGTR